MTPPTTADVGPTPGAEDQDPFIADLREIYTDRTLVLIGCGKAKRDPDDPVDVHEAAVAPGEAPDDVFIHGADTGPAWEAKDLYTSNYFSAKRSFAEVVSRWAHDHGATSGWSILSAEHHVLHPWEVVTPYDTTIDDLGDDPTNEDHWVDSMGRRRPDGQEMVTELDQWAALVAACLAKWTASFRDGPAALHDPTPNTLLVLAGQSYVQPLRERGVFEYGIDRMAGDPNHLHDGLGVRTRFLFEEIDAGGNGEQMAWLSDAVDRLDDIADPGEQRDLETWSGSTTACDGCGTPAAEADLRAFGSEIYCPDCEPIGRCSRCDEWTHENGLGAYPLCADCQTERGGQVREPIDADDGEQGDLSGWSE